MVDAPVRFLDILVLITCSMRGRQRGHDGAVGTHLFEIPSDLFLILLRILWEPLSRNRSQTRPQCGPPRGKLQWPKVIIIAAFAV